MKKPLFITICLLLAFTSCKKNSSDAPANTISATIDGVVESFNTGGGAQLGTAVQLNSNLVITGANGVAAGSDVMSITISSNTSIAEGVYTNSGANNAGFTSILYSKGPFSLTNPNIYATDVNGTHLTTVTITSLSSTNIKGTFSGQLLLNGGSTVKAVTNGKFNLSIK